MSDGLNTIVLGSFLRSVIDVETYVCKKTNQKVIDFEKCGVNESLYHISIRNKSTSVEGKIIDSVDKDYLDIRKIYSIGGLKSPFSKEEAYYNPNSLFYDSEIHYPDNGYQEVEITYLIDFLKRVEAIDFREQSEHDICLILHNLFENYFTYSAANRNKISFFEQTKLRAGVASSIYLYMKDEDLEVTTKDFLNKKNIMMACSFDFLGIKDFKFIKSNTSSLKRETAASLFVDLFRENVLDSFLDEIGLTRCNLIFSGGRHLHMFLPNSRKTVNHIRTYIEKINDWLVENFGTVMFVSYGIAPVDSLNLGDYRGDKFYLDIFTQIANDKAKMESHMYTAKNISVMNHGIRLNEEIISEIERRAEQGKLVDFSLLERRYCLKKSMISRDIPAISTWYQPLYEGKADIYRDEMCVMRFDIDNFRTFMLSNHAGEIKPFEKMELSKNFSMFLRRDVGILLERFLKAGKDNCVIHEGADDMFIIAPKKYIREIAICLEEHYKRFTGGRITFSAGLSEYIRGCSFAENCALAQQLMDKAKKVPNKNAIVWKDDRNQMKWMDFIGHDENC